MPNEIESPKSWLSRPEGKVGAAFLLICLALIIIFGGVIGSFIVTAVDNMLHLTIVGGVLLAILFMALDPKMRTLVFYLYRSFWRWIVGMFTNIDPIGIRQTYVEQAKKTYKDLDEKIGRLRGQRLQTKHDLETVMTELQTLVNEAKVVRTQTDQGPLNVIAHKIERRDASKKSYAEALAMLEDLLVRSSKYQKMCGEVIEDLEDDITTRKRNKSFNESTRGVIRNMQAILKGAPGKDMYDDAGLVLDQQYTDTLGMVENFNESMTGVLAADGLHDAAAVQGLLAKLDAIDDGPKVKTLPPPATGAAPSAA